MSQRRSLTTFFAGALFGAGILALVQCSHEEPGSGGAGDGSGTKTGGATAGDVELTLHRELGAAWYGEADVAEGGWEKSHDFLKKAAESGGATAQDLINLACVKLKLWQTDPQKQQAETPLIKELCGKALAKDPNLATAHYMAGLVAMDRDNDLATAQREFEATVKLLPEDVPTKMRLAEVLNEAGDRDGAIALYQWVRGRGLEFANSYYVTAIYRLARLLRLRKQGEDVKVAGALLDEHTALTEAGVSSPGDDDLKLGNLARVKLPPRSGPLAPAPGSPPGLKFDVLEPLLQTECPVVRSVDATDLDNDGHLDLLVAGDDAVGAPVVFALLQGAGGKFEPVKIDSGKATRVVAIDLENEFNQSLLLLGDGAPRLLSPIPLAVAENDPNRTNRWQDGTAQLPPLPATIRDLARVDFGHDGHLDFVLATDDGLKFIRNDGVPVDQYTKERTGPVKLTDVTAESKPPAGKFAWIDFEDFDCDQDIDLIVGGPGVPTTVISNLRKGRFESLGPDQTGLPKEIATKPLLADFDHDGKPDLLTLGGVPQLCRNGGAESGNVKFEAARPLADLAPFAVSGFAALGDLDLNGELDLVGSAADSVVAARFGSLLTSPAASMGLGGKPAPGAAPLLADLDDDGDLDVVLLAEKGVAIHRNDAAFAFHSFPILLQGVKDNRQATGAIVEIRTRDHYERRLAREPRQSFGLGASTSPDVLRITWPNGVVQHVIQPGNRVRPVQQKEGLIGSCPFLYSWDGERYVFISDVLGITPLGLPMKEGEYVPPDHDELVRVTEKQCQPIDGQYRFQFTEELREVTYFDRAQLWVVDHPADVEVHPEERFTFPPFPPQHLHTVRGALPLVKAIDQKGRDWTEALAAADNVHAVPFEPLDSRYLGLVTAHTLELSLPDAVRTAKKIRLLMTGWFYWTDASVNVLAGHNGSIDFVPPIFSAPDGKGGWAECGPPVGFPAGKTKTMVLDVTSMVNRDDPRLKIFSTIRLYWDQIRVAVDDDDAPITVTKLEPTTAKLWERGFSAPIACGKDDQPARFDWDHKEPLARWNQHPGMLTRLGDVRPLLSDVDDRYVILSSGDAIDLRFDATTTPPKPGTARTYILFFDGWAKDADPNTLYSQSVAPLPFHAMSGYPYRADEHYPDDDAHIDYRLEWNTRPSRHLIPSLARPEASSPR